MSRPPSSLSLYSAAEREWGPPPPADMGPTTGLEGEPKCDRGGKEGLPGSPP
jgi:hypothetical protein